MQNTRFLLVELVLILAAATALPAAEQHWLVLESGDITIGVGKDLALSVHRGPGAAVWKTVQSSTPAVGVQIVGPDGKETATNIPMGKAADRKVEDYDDGLYKGHRIRLRELPDIDVEVELVLALASNGELLVQIEQVGGKNSVQRVAGLYDWKIESAADSYMVVPHGSGYIIRSDSTKAVRLNGFVGAAYSLPMFGIVAGKQTCYQIVDTWWDAHVAVVHTPGQGTLLSLDWEASLGKLRYPRRVLFRFAENLDHVGMAKAYRRYLIERGEFSTLTQRAEKTPALKKFLAGIEYRVTGWNPQQQEQALDNIRHFQEASLPVSFFYPKWPALGYSPERSGLQHQNAGWQGYLQEVPVPGGWPTATKLEQTVHQLGCTVKLMVSPYLYLPDAPAYDPAKASTGWPAISGRYAEWAIGKALDNLHQKGFKFEALYFDAYSAYRGHSEQKDAVGPVSRRQTFEAQAACFRETRRRGIVPGAELARFWSIADCDFFFFTDWSSDRLRDAEPIPWVPLVFGDCYASHFSGGGYYNEGKYDWYADRHPRLYELMYAAMPSHNWLPGGSRPIAPEDWGTEAMNRRLKWLRRWHAYFQQVCYREMLTHKFLNPQRTLQRVEFAGGVVAEFDLAKGLFRVQGVPGFTGDWEKPEEVTR